MRQNTLAGGRDPERKIVVHKCSGQAKHASNAAVLMGAYMVFELGMTTEEIVRRFSKGKKRFQPFLDAGVEPDGFKLLVEDCCKALEGAKAKGWYNPDTFDVDEYERLNDLTMDDTGDMNWIVPGKLLAMTSPSINRAEGMPPLNYIDFFKAAGISAVVRLNEKLYIDEDFYRHGIRVYPMELIDGGTPNENMITDFLMQAELEIEGREGAVAVHCRAGQGRTGTFCASYLMFKYGFTAKMAIAWVRMCRPGSVYGAN